MALAGHADDCAACNYEALPDEDKAKAVLDTDAFAKHVRQEPPDPPQKRDRGAVALVAGFGLLAFLVAIATGAVLAGVAGLLLGLGSAILDYRAKDQERGDVIAWQSRMDSWKGAQTAEWLRQRSLANVWPCPNCGSVSCPNRHLVTTTVRYPLGVSHSRTDPA